MLRLTLAAGVACAVVLGNPAGAQFNTSSIGTSNIGSTSIGTTTTTGSSMPGQVVGGYRGSVSPVGKKIPAAAPQVGQPITANGMMQPYDPKNPYAAFKGTNLNPKDVLAPLVAPDGYPVESPDALDKLSEKIKSLWGFASPAPQRPPWVPGIARRNRERVHMLWRRD